MESQNENATPEVANALAEQTVEPATTNEEVNEVPAEQLADPAPAPEELVDEPKEDKNSKVVKELIGQRKKRQQAEQEAAYWKGIAEGRGHKEEPAKPVQQTGELKPPVLDDFETFEAFEAAKDEYLIQRAEQRVLKKQQEQQEQKRVEEAQLTFKQRLDDAAAVDPEIYETVNEVAKLVSPIVAELVVNSDAGIEIVKFFEQNPKEALRISKLQPLQAAKEMGMLEMKLVTVPPKPEPPKKVSAAPQPIKTVTPAGSPVVDEDDLPMEEYYKRRTKVLYGR